MLQYMLRRFFLLIPVLLGVTLVVFLVSQLTADPTKVILGQHATAQQMEALRHELGLDKPVYQQYILYVLRLLRGDLGRSWLTDAPVAQEIMVRFPHTVELTLVSITLAIFFGVLVGVISAVKQYSFFDHLSMIGALLGVSMPIFWLGLMLMTLFSVRLGWLPISGRIDLQLEVDFKTQFYLLESLLRGNWPVFKNLIAHITLPAIALAANSTALIARMTRSSVLEVIRQDYIRTARAKGLGERVVIYKHALKNALIPVVTVVGLQFGSLLSGAVLTETVFSWPGIGSLAVAAIQNADNPLVQGTVLLVAAIFVLVNLVVDLLYAYIDPRIHYT